MKHACLIAICICFSTNVNAASQDSAAGERETTISTVSDVNARGLTRDTSFRNRNAGSEPRPNVVIFLVDDLGYMDIACNGSDLYETPNIDRLAKAGMRFTRAYAACGVCSPSRHAIMSGKYPGRSGCTNYGMPMQSTEFTLAESMKENGYDTWFIGKWHLGNRQGQHPEDQGFDVNVGGGVEGQPGSYFWPYQRKNRIREGTLTRHLKKGGKEGEYLTDRLGDEAVTLLDNRSADNPFFMFFSFYSVHTPIMAKQDDVAYFKKKIGQMKSADGPGTKMEGDVAMNQVQDSPQFASMVKSVDDAVGKVVAKLKKEGLFENTLIFFTSDNGGAAYYKKATSNVPLRGAKGWYFEGGIRVPFVVSWPKRISSGVSAENVIGTDLYPTIMDLTGGTPRPEQHIDGVSIRNVLLHQETLPERNLYWYYPHDHGSGSRAASAMIAGDHKLIWSLRTEGVQVFDLGEDPGEQTDLSKTDPELAEKLVRQLKAWQSELGLAERLK